MTATLKDVARESGLNVSTVSRILNNRGYISDEARARVDAAMEKLHYQRNEVARSLRSRQTHLVGVIMEEISDPLWSLALEETVQILDRNGYQVLLFQTGREEGGGARCLSQCLARQTDGVILMADARGAEEEYPFPLISIGERSAAAARIRCDFHGAGRLAAEHLTSHGYQPLFHVYEQENSASLQCRKGFSEVCAQRGASFSEIPFSGSWVYRLLYTAARFGASGRIPGIFISSSAAAQTVLAAAESLGMRIPEDLALIRMDDGKENSGSDPAAAWIRPDIRKMTSCACERLLSAVQGGPLPEETSVPMEWIPARQIQAKAV